MKYVVNRMKVVLEIAKILHDNEVPISQMGFVFNEVRHEIEMHTIPYEPSKEEMLRAASHDGI